MPVGYAKVPHILLRDGRLQPTTKAILFALISHADRGTGECWPSLGTLAREAGVSKRVVPTHLRKLVAFGLISMTRRTRPDTQELDSSLYRLAPACREPISLRSV